MRAKAAPEHNKQAAQAGAPAQTYTLIYGQPLHQLCYDWVSRLHSQGWGLIYPPAGLGWTMGCSPSPLTGQQLWAPPSFLAHHTGVRPCIGTHCACRYKEYHNTTPGAINPPILLQAAADGPSLGTPWECHTAPCCPRSSSMV